MGSLNEEGHFRIPHFVFFQVGIVIPTKNAVEISRGFFDHFGDIEECCRPLSVHGCPLVRADLRTMRNRAGEA